MNLCDLIIQRAKPEDINKVEMTFKNHFLRDEPLNICLGQFKSIDPPPNLLSNHELTLIATIAEPNHRLPGFLTNKICSPGYMEEWRRSAYESNNKLMIEPYLIFNELNSKFNIFERYEIDEAFEMGILCVNNDFRGKSIGTRLCAEGIELAKSEGQKFIFMDCSSNHTRKIAEKLGMQCIGEISYENYRNVNGEKIFRAIPPHTHLRRFVKILDI